MSDCYSLLAQADAADVLSLNRLPELAQDAPSLMCAVKAGQLHYTSSTSKASRQVGSDSGDRVIGFGPQLCADDVYTLLLRLCPHSENDLSLHAWQPSEQLPAAVVLGGFSSLAAIKPVLAELAEALAVELVVVAQPPTPTRPGLLLMDMDSTAIEIECIDEIAVLAGVGEAVSAVTKRAMQGELDFAESLEQRVAALRGADEGILAKVADNMPLMPGLLPLVTHLQDRGWQVAIASGGFTYFTERLKQQLGLCATFANRLEIINGRLTGKVLGEIVDATTKAGVVETLALQYDLPISQTVAIGDGANDLKMLAKAGLGVAFHAKPVVRQQARAAINQGSLLQLLYLLLPRIEDRG